jgi:hypothetical protein
MVYIICCPVMLEMNSYMIATVSIIAAAVLIAATIAVPISSNSANAVNSNRALQGLSQNGGRQTGLVNLDNLGIQAQVQANCAVAVLSSGSCG